MYSRNIKKTAFKTKKLLCLNIYLKMLINEQKQILLNKANLKYVKN